MMNAVIFGAARRTERGMTNFVRQLAAAVVTVSR